MIRVLHMIGSLEVGGSQSLIMNIYRNIDRNEIQFDFIIDHSEDMHFAEEIRKLGGKIHEMPAISKNNIIKVRKAWDDFFETHEEYKILHSHVRSYASLYIPIAKRHGLTTIIHSHNTSNGHGYRSIIKAVLQYPLRFQADYFMACSVGAGKWLFGNRIVNSNRFFLLKNGIDITKYKFDAEQREVIRKELGIGDKNFVVGFLARVEQQKNPYFVVDVFEHINKLMPLSKLLFVGDGKLLADIDKYAEKKGLASDIIFTGIRTDVANMMLAMDVYILPSFWEGLGISLIEAEAAGLTCYVSENIQDDAILTDDVMRLNLNLGACFWAKQIVNTYKYDRKDNCQIVKRAGYDIQDTSSWLVCFYKRIAI